MSPSSLVVLLFLLFFFSISCSTSSINSVTHETFLRCMSAHLPLSKTQFLEQVVHTQNTSNSYSSLLYPSLGNHRFVSNTSLKPLVILTPLLVSEIQAGVLCSRKHGLQIRVRSGGHDYESLSSRCNSPFIIVDLMNLRSVNVNLDDETAWVEAGATLGEVYYGIAMRSRTHGFPAGTCPSVGVGGLFSGGGIGTLMRKYGISADNVIDAHLIDANGKILDRESMGEDLFWAIRGGGGASFGVIVSWRIKLVHVPPTVTVFTVHKTLEQGAAKLIHRWQSIAHKLHEDLFIRVIVQIIDHGETVHGAKNLKVGFNSIFLGSIKDLIPLMNQSFTELDLKPNDCTEMTWIESILYFVGYYPKGTPIDVLLNRTNQDQSFFKAKSDFVKTPIPEKALKRVLKWYLKEKTAFMIMDPFGGRMSEVSEFATPFPHRDGNLYNIQYLVKWEEKGDKALRKHLHWIRKLYRYMSPYVSSSPRAAYLNYRDLDLGTNGHGSKISLSRAKVWGRKYFKRNFKRLALVKGKVDPDNFFRNEQSIPPLFS